MKWSSRQWIEFSSLDTDSDWFIVNLATAAEGNFWFNCYCRKAIICGYINWNVRWACFYSRNVKALFNLLYIQLSSCLDRAILMLHTVIKDSVDRRGVQGLPRHMLNAWVKSARFWAVSAISEYILIRPVTRGAAGGAKPPLQDISPPPPEKMRLTK